MLQLKNILQADGSQTDLSFPSSSPLTIDGKGELLLLPALIDAHVHFRTPGAEHKESWVTASQAALAGGVTTVFDMPNTSPSTITQERIQAKKKRIDQQLEEAKIPLRYHLYLGADRAHFHQVPLCRSQVIGLKVYMGSTTGDLLMDQDAAIEQAFKIGAENQMVVSIHAEDEKRIASNQSALLGPQSPPEIHSRIRDPIAAAIAVDKAIHWAEKWGTRLYILHVSTAEEIARIRKAKERGLPIYCEVTPHHLYLDDQAYASLGTLVQMNPPLRTAQDRAALWEAIHDGTVDSIGTDHAPHTLAEKQLPYGQAPSGVPGVETLLPLLLTSYLAGELSLQQIQALTRTNNQRIFSLQDNDDFVLVNLKEKRTVRGDTLKSRCGWSPYEGWELSGWPQWTRLKGKMHELTHIPCALA